MDLSLICTNINWNVWIVMDHQAILRSTQNLFGIKSSWWNTWICCEIVCNMWLWEIRRNILICTGFDEIYHEIGGCLFCVKYTYGRRILVASDFDPSVKVVVVFSHDLSCEHRIWAGEVHPGEGETNEGER